MACKQFVGRFLLVLIFFASGVAKISDPAPQQGFLVARYEMNYNFYSKYGVPLPGVDLIKEFSKAIILAMGAVMFVAALLTLFNMKYGPCVLTAQMALITVIMHNPLLATNSQDSQLELISALKNLAIIGGLMQICCQQCAARVEPAPTDKSKKKVD